MLGNGQLLFLAGGIAVGYFFHPAITTIVTAVLALLGHKAVVPASVPTPAPVSAPADPAKPT